MAHKHTNTQHSSNSDIKIPQFYWSFLVESAWFLFWWCPLLSVDCFHKLCLSGTPSEDCQAGWDLGKLCLRYSSVLFEKWGGASFLERNRTLQYLRHNFPWDRLILRQTNNPWPSYSQDLNPPDYFLREYLKERVCENNPNTREDIIRREIRRISEEKVHRVVDNFNVRVAAVLSYSSAVHGTNKVLITEKV